MYQEAPRGKDYLGLATLVILVIWFGHEIIWGGKVPFFRDMGTYFYPMRFSLAESFKSGELPLWDTHVAMGFPLLADFQSATFYLPHLAYLILPFFTAVQVLFVFHYLLAATGSYFLCRSWRMPPYLAVIGGVLFTFGGTIVSLTNVLNHFQTAVWLPWVLLCGERYVRNPSWDRLLALTLVLLCQWLAGSPEFYLMSAGLLLVNSVRVKRLVPEPAISHPKLLLGLLTANALAMGLSMAQLLPTAELFLESRGQRSILYSEASQWSLHPASLVNLFFFDKEIDLVQPNGIRLFAARQIPFLISYYIGALSLFGIWFFMACASRKEIIITSVLIAISLVLTMGNNTPFYPFIFQYVPLVKLFRFPEKFFFLTYALFLFAIMRGLWNFLELKDSPSRKPLFGIAVICAVVSVTYFYLVLNSGFVSKAIAAITSDPTPPATIAAAYLYFERQVALIIGLSVLFFLWSKGILRPELLRPLLVIVAFFDLGFVHAGYQFLIRPADVVHNPPKIIDPVPFNRVFFHPAAVSLHPSNFLIPKRPTFTEVYPIVFSNVLPNTGVLAGINYMQEIDALSRWPYVAFLTFANNLSPDRLYRLLGALNVEYINSFRPLPDKGVTLLRHFPEHPAWVYKVSAVIPRAYIASSPFVETDPVKILNGMASPEFDPRRHVYLDQAVALESKTSSSGKAEIKKYSNQQVIIHTSLTDPGVLILADSFYPGWRVYVNAKEQTIMRANLFFRGVLLAAGEHTVEFRYRPQSFVIGMGISLSTLLAVLFITLHHSLKAWNARAKK